MVNYNQIINNLKVSAKKLKNVKSFVVGDLSELDINKLGMQDYPLIYVENGNVSIDTQTMSYNFTIYVLMQSLNEDIKEQDQFRGIVDNFESERQGVQDTYNTTLKITQDLISIFRQNLYSLPISGFPADTIEQEIILQMPITAQPVSMQFDNILSGYTIDIELQVNNRNNLCTAAVLDFD